MKLEHVALNIPDVHAQSLWFVENFGLKIVMEGDTAPYFHFLSDGQGAMLEFYSNTAVNMPDYANVHPSNVHIAFSSDDIEADRDRLIAAGATIFSDVASTARGDKLVFLRNPWQLPFQFVQRAQPLE